MRDLFQVKEVIGVGSFSKVYRVVHRPTQEELALKVLKKKHLQSASGAKRFRLQSEILQNGKHPNLVRFMGAYEDDSAHYLVLEYCPSKQLFDNIVRAGRMSEKQAKRVMRQIVMGLEELHRMGYCHRDLKPENILIARKGVVKLADFGLAGMLSKQLVKSCGSPIYAAPEMMRRKPYDGTRSDVWSCGVVLYAMVVGSLPFDSVQLLRKYIAKQHRLQLPTYLTNECRDLIKAMLVCDPALRPTTKQLRFNPWLAFRVERKQYQCVASQLLLKEAAGHYGLQAANLAEMVQHNAKNQATLHYEMLLQKHGLELFRQAGSRSPCKREPRSQSELPRQQGGSGRPPVLTGPVNAGLLSKMSPMQLRSFVALFLRERGVEFEQCHFQFKSEQFLWEINQIGGLNLQHVSVRGLQQLQPSLAQQLRRREKRKLVALVFDDK